ncbi:MAG: membrane dipeptidase [Candidatus Latescibacterota bacterium]|nr:MAG: membrane dipeptidase [Candidatus Latescibacterota bacterium]
MKPPPDISREAWQIHEHSIVIDLHADTLFLVFMFGYRMGARHRNPFPRSPFIYHVDIPRLREGGVTAIGLTAPVIPLNILRRRGSVLRAIQKVDRWAGTMRTQLVMARSGADILKAREKGVPAFFLTLEGAHGVRGELEEIEAFKRHGLVSIGLAHLTRSPKAYPNRRARWRERRLPEAGYALIEKMEATGLIVDLAHVASRSFLDAVEFCKKPPIVSHTGFQSMKPMWRNISDYEAKRVAKKDGVLGVVFHPGYLTRSRNRSLDCVIENIRFLLKTVGDDFVALGSDFDGWVPSMPTDMGDVSYLPRLTDRMLRDGIPVDSIRKILGGNAMRVIREVCDGLPGRDEMTPRPAE